MSTEQRGEAEEIGATRDSLSDSSSPRAQPPSDSGPEDMFVRHKVSKLDTLAGLAIRYHVTVSDIKRANGLLSDTAMFARDTLLIPTKPLPVGAEYSTWAGMIVMQYGKLRSKDACPAGVKYKQQLAGRHTSIDELRGYYSTSPAGSSPNSTSGDEDDQRVAGANGNHWRSSREVELMERNTGGASSSYAEDRLTRRRRQGEGGSGEGGGGGGGASTDGGEFCGSPLSAAAAGMMAFLQPFADLMESGAPSSSRSSSQSARRPPGRRKESLLDRIKKVASQPALAVSAAPIGIAHVAEAVIRTARGGAGSSGGGGDPGHHRAQALQQAAYNLVTPPKESKKSD